ncbi:hypothetical protein TNCV_1759401 [Trichonephila clavipes]|nr:hypothetical protein TNCV_1759401 [Trichonephila clavipes]
MDKGKISVILVDRLKSAFMEIADPFPAQVKQCQLHPGLVQCRRRLRPGMADLRFQLLISSRQPLSTNSEEE